MKTAEVKLEWAYDFQIIISENTTTGEVPAEPQTVDGLALYTITE